MPHEDPKGHIEFDDKGQAYLVIDDEKVIKKAKAESAKKDKEETKKAEEAKLKTEVEAKSKAAKR